MPPLTGRVVAGRYRLIEPIGRGAMGVVWRASDQLLDRDVAVKEVRFNPALGDVERANAYKRTLREARTAARLSHRGVVTVFDVVEENARPFIIMELIRSRSLDEMLATEGPLPARRGARVAQQLLSALSHAHAAGVLHRDVKPSNVLIATGGYDERAVLTDFGIAQFEGDPRLTQTGMVMGSPGFTAPERIRGGTATPASDLWSLGATLFAACEGRGPYEARGGAITTMSAIINEDAPPARTAGRMGPIIAALLRRDPARRPTASAAAAMITDILHTLPPEAHPRTPTALAPTRKPATPPPAPAVAPTGIDAPSPASKKPGQVAGPARDPRATPSTPAQPATPQVAAAKAAAKAVAGEGRGGAKEDADGPDTAPYDAVPPDAVPPKTVPPDAVPPKTVPPKTVPPKTVAEGDSGPDTAPYDAAEDEGGPGTASPKTASPKTASPKTASPKTASPNTAPPKADPPNAALPKAVADNDAEPPAASREAPADGSPAGDPPDAAGLADAAAADAAVAAAAVAKADPADARPSGPAASGTTADGSAADGTAANGVAAEGVAADGSAADGSAADGSATDGSAADGVAADGSVAAGASDGDVAAEEAAEAAAPALAFATSMETAIRSKPSVPALSQQPAVARQPAVEQAPPQAPAAPLTAATARAPRQAQPEKDAWWANAYQPQRPVAGPARNPPLPVQPAPQPYSQPARYPQPASWPSGSAATPSGTIPQPSFPDDQAPLPSGGTSARPLRRGRRKVLVALAVLAVAAAAAGAVAAAVLPKHGHSGGTGATAGTGTQSSATATGPVPPITGNTPPVVTNFDMPSAAVPAGFTQMTFPAAKTGTKAGFTIACPSNWTVRQQPGAPQRIHFQDPNSSAHVDVDLTQHTNADMLAEAEYVKQRTLAENLFPGYKQLELDAQNLRDTRGGLWRFDYTGSKGVTMRADDLLFILQTPNGPQSYAIFGAAPEGPNASNWNKVALPIIEKMLASFEPSPAS